MTADMKHSLLLIALFALTSCNIVPHSTEGISDKVVINGVTLDYLKKGKGPPLYLLHGGMESRNSFEAQIESFSESFTVIALDSREQGRSSRADTQITYDLMAKDVIGLADHLGHDRISIVGLSDGGVTGLTVGMKAPDLIDKLVLLGANYHYSSYPEATRQYIASYEWEGDTDPDKYPGSFIKHYRTGHDDLKNFGNLLKEMSVMWTSSPNYTPSDLGTIQAPTLLINGDHEDMDLDHVMSLYKALPNAQLFIVPDATHYSLEEKPDLLNSVILDFLND